jgi:hypothetical protein
MSIFVRRLSASFRHARMAGVYCDILSLWAGKACGQGLGGIYEGGLAFRCCCVLCTGCRMVCDVMLPSHESNHTQFTAAFPGENHHDDEGLFAWGLRVLPEAVAALRSFADGAFRVSDLAHALL